nr:ABC transporter ATP-binding protein [Motiliproteus sp. SC1-56]
MLEVNALHKSFVQAEQQVPVIRGVDMTLAAGEVVVLLGRSGGGKSTLLNLMAGIETPDSGDIRFQGEPFAELDDRGRTLIRRRRIGVIFQFFNLVPTLTVAENLQLPLQLNRQPLGGRVDAMLEALGLVGLGQRFPEQLSGGEQQRVAIGRALIHSPPLLLADEPTGSLDASSAEQVVKLLIEQVRVGGHGLLLVTHNAELAALGDRTLILEEGRLKGAPERKLS